MERVKGFINDNSQTILYVGGGILVLLVLWHIYAGSLGMCRQAKPAPQIDQAKLIEDINKKINEMDLCGCGGKEPQSQQARSSQSSQQTKSPEAFGNTNFY